jgi:hypothetical protein
MRAKQIDTYTLTLIGKDGLQCSIGERGAPKFHLFHDWNKARLAIADAVATVGLNNVHTVATVMTQTFDGQLVDFNVSHFTPNELRDLCELANHHHDKPGQYVTRGDGRRVRVTVPTK